ncbi:LOW QUALITY PROTEIN: ribonuclease P protein subunit p30-like [Lytechinus variegatus]|uniref:LOW QUALITY PROTEIN: ribonuclease P protein subunit p30-like n=1 Tax=Lytechinus variegatus TaxID=7654 RepID=UPI001BB28AE8|nr:LOW QUALITY PROTEIN: ribonuclease P protein subunit p30-like [Lytechinus variegatus]
MTCTCMVYGLWKSNSIENMTQFFDLNLIDNRFDEKRKQRAIARAARLGYEVVAIDHRQKKLDRKSKIPSAPERSKHVESDQLKAQGKELKVLSRLTVTLDDSAQTIVLRSDSTSTYDILAVEPTTEKMFHKACTELEIDIISCDMTTKLPFYFKYHSIKPALERGVKFEICYSPAIRDTSLRRYLFHNALDLVSVTKGKNIILSGAVENAMEIRGPHDVANLGNLFGLSEDKAKAAISINCHSALVHAFTRNCTVRSAMSVQKVTELAPSELWKVKASLEASGLSVEQLREMEAKAAKKPVSQERTPGEEPKEKRQKQR